jgi:hypothetical protein
MKKSQQTSKNTTYFFDPNVYMIDGLSKSDIIQLKKAFDLLDTSASGKIDLNCKKIIN